MFGELHNVRMWEGISEILLFSFHCHKMASSNNLERTWQHPKEKARGWRRERKTHAFLPDGHISGRSNVPRCPISLLAKVNHVAMPCTRVPQSVVFRPAALASPGHWKMRILRAHPLPTQSETPKLGPESQGCNKFSRWFWCMLRFESHHPNHWQRKPRCFTNH